VAPLAVQTDPRLVSSLKRFSAVAGVFIFIVGSVLLAGRALGVVFLKSAFPSLITMRTEVALSLLLAGASLWLLRKEGAGQPVLSLGRTLAFIVMLVGLLALIEYGFDLNLGLDRLLFNGSSKASPPSNPIRMAPTTALCLLILGTALLLLYNRRGHLLAQSLALAATLIALLAFIGYIYEVEALYGIVTYMQMALHPSVAFLVACLGIFCSRPDRGLMATVTSDSLGGVVARRLFPASIVLPFLLGWLGLIGQRGGLYNTGVGLALLVASHTTLFILLTWWSARLLHQADEGRRKVEEALRRARDELELRVRERTAELVRANEALQDEIGERRRVEVRLKEYAERLQTLSHRLLEVQEVERRRVARELHDEVGQALTGLKLILEISTQLPTNAFRAKLGEARVLVNELMARVRDLSLDLRPAMLDDLGLLPALLWHLERYTAQTHVQVDLRHAGLDGRRFAPEIETAAYRIAQEALTNVARHARSNEAIVRVWAGQETLRVQIEDHGIGFDPEALIATGATSGLAGMRERAELLRGQLIVESRLGNGTRLTAELPLGGKSGATSRLNV
jgi:signal transduction histidine kinase